MDTPKHIVIIGGGYAGLLSALRLVRQLNRHHVNVTLIDGKDHFVERLRLHQLSAGQPLSHYTYTEFLKGTAVNFLQGWVTGIAPEAQTITVHRDHKDVTLHYDYLVYALGSLIDTKSVPGVSEYAMSVSTEETSLALHQKLVSLPGHSEVVVCGGGLTGIEISAEFAESYPNLNVSLVTKGKVGTTLSAKAQDYLKATFDRLHIRLLEYHTVEEVTPTQVRCENDRAINYDLCVWSGAFTVPKLAQHSGLPVNRIGQVRVDQQLRVQNYDTIYAIGDSATLEDALDIPIRMACGTSNTMALFVTGQIVAQIESRDDKTYEFHYFATGISLGRNDALVQFVESDDTPKSQIMSGRFAKILKELGCALPTAYIKLERFRARRASKTVSLQKQPSVLQEV